MINKSVGEALNAQTNAEMYSAYRYLSMSASLSDKGLSGMANWMRKQAEEEMEHAMKIYDYVIESGGRVSLFDIEATTDQWDSALAVFEHVYAHEQKVTGMIHGLVDLASGEKDHATQNFLQWFVKEQVEEEDHSREILDKARLIGNNGPGLFLLDRDLGQRGI
ncbi:MAG: ferritin [Candidatus Thermoplasmatota archaeon]|jgi:ferritin|nr:ferritin [Candidatus Thermoplasmatota archaeon]